MTKPVKALVITIVSFTAFIVAVFAMKLYADLWFWLADGEPWGLGVGLATILFPFTYFLVYSFITRD